MCGLRKTFLHSYLTNTPQVARQNDSIGYDWAQKLRNFLANLVTWPDPIRPNPTRSTDQPDPCPALVFRAAQTGGERTDMYEELRKLILFTTILLVCVSIMSVDGNSLKVMDAVSKPWKGIETIDRIFSARCNISLYISRLCYDVSVRLSVCDEMHWRIIGPS